MSYYSKQKYEFTDHALQRCRERLNLKNKQDYEVREIAYDLINKSMSNFENKNFLYISVNNTENFFIVDKSTMSIITYRRISIEKQFDLTNDFSSFFENDD